MSEKEIQNGWIFSRDGIQIRDSGIFGRNNIQMVQLSVQANDVYYEQQKTHEVPLETWDKPLRKKVNTLKRTMIDMTLKSANGTGDFDEAVNALENEIGKCQIDMLECQTPSGARFVFESRRLKEGSDAFEYSLQFRAENTIRGYVLRITKFRPPGSEEYIDVGSEISEEENQQMIEEFRSTFRRGHSILRDTRCSVIFREFEETWICHLYIIDYMVTKINSNINKIALIFSRCIGISPNNAFKGLGISVRGTNKFEQIYKGLFELYKTDSEGFSIAVERLVEHHTISRNDRELLKSRLSYLCYTLGENNKISKAAEIPLVMPGSRLKAALTIHDILRTASKEILIVDNYLNEDVLYLLLDVIENASVRILTHPRMWKNPFITYFNKFKLDRKDMVEIRLTTKIHDRYICVDNAKLFTVGHSIKNLGEKLTSILEIKEDVNSKIALLNSFWIASVTPT